jgi:hypothetical protein
MKLKTIMQNQTNAAIPSAAREAARFWERGRLLYTAILTVVVLLWLVLTWPHFRPALTLGSFEVFVVLGLLANLCYSAAYLAEFFIQLLAPGVARRRARIALFVLGTLFALVLENYWIADEIYPYANNPPPNVVAGATTMPTAFASNMNFPAPLAVLGFLVAIFGFSATLASVLIFWFARKPRFARIAAITTGACAVVYFAFLFGFSAGSHETVLAHGQEKYFCEIDCHLAYSVLDAKTQPDGHLVISLRTRFDETTTSPNRPKDAPLTPSPREVRLIDSAGRTYAPVVSAGTPLLTPLKPADSYTTQLEFNLPKDATGLRLLINTIPQWPDRVVIGDENSWLHKKTYFAL